MGRWTDEEDDIIRNLYYKTSYQELHTYLPNKSTMCIKQRITKLGFPKLMASPWTPEELSLLTNSYETLSALEIKEMYLPYRTLQAIKTRINRLGLTKRK